MSACDPPALQVAATPISRRMGTLCPSGVRPHSGTGRLTSRAEACSALGWCLRPGRSTVRHQYTPFVTGGLHVCGNGVTVTELRDILFSHNLIGPIYDSPSLVLPCCVPAAGHGRRAGL